MINFFAPFLIRRVVYSKSTCVLIKSLVIVISFLVLPLKAAFPQQYFVDMTDSRLPSIVDASDDCEFGDLDSDGAIDIVVGNADYGIVNLSYFTLNNGSGTFPQDNLSFFNYPLASTSPKGVALGDIERDGDLDAIFANLAGDEESINRLFVNDGSAHFEDRSEAQLPPDRTERAMEAHFADVDSDLDLDLSIFEWNGLPNQLWINSGAGYFGRAAEERFPSGEDGTIDAGWFDVDGDFDLDCLIVNGNGFLNRLMINDGRGWFTEEGGWRLPEDRTMSTDIEYFDVDNDGDLDAYIAEGFFPGNDRMLINNGNGYFTDESAARIPQYGDQSFGVSIGDIDNDGDLDIFVANSSVGGTHSSRIYVNDGTGHFSDETSSRYPSIDEESGYGAFGDVDNDGDLDLYVANHGYFENGEQNRLLINMSTPDSFPPVINRTLTHEDTGDTVGPYIMMTEVWDNVSRNIGELSVTLHHRVEEGEFAESQMYYCDGHMYRYGIGGFRPGSKVEYYIEAVDRLGNSTIDPASAPDSIYSFTVTATGIKENDPESMLPGGFSLSQNFPNPFNPSTSISFNIPGYSDRTVRVNLVVYDVRGRLVRELIDSDVVPGSHSALWNGSDEKAKQVPSGVYLYRLASGHQTSTKKMTLLR